MNNEASQLVNEQRQQSDVQVRDLKEKLQEQQQMMKMLEEQQEEFHKQQRILEKKLEEREQQIKTLVAQQNGSHIEIRIPPYYITLSNFQDMKASGSIINSPQMYTHSIGYTFRFALQPNGPIVGVGH